MTIRRSVIQRGARRFANADLGSALDMDLVGLWKGFLRVEKRVDCAWAAFDQAQSGRGQHCVEHLFDRADAIGHEYDNAVRRIAAQPAASWQGVTIKLLTWRRTVDLSDTGLPDADTALAFSAYLDALRLTPGAIAAANDVALAGAALRCPDSTGERS